VGEQYAVRIEFATRITAVVTTADEHPHRRVVAVIWRRGNHMRLTYEDGTSSLVVAAPSVAEGIAKDAGLAQDSSSEGVLSWERPAPWVPTGVVTAPD
jgi:hypothetical protein